MMNFMMNKDFDINKIMAKIGKNIIKYDIVPAFPNQPQNIDNSIYNGMEEWLLMKNKSDITVQ